MTTDIRVPAYPERFLGMLIPDADIREAVLGDLREEHHRIATEGTLRAANRWYWSEIAESAIPFVMLWLVGGGARDRIRFGLAVLLGYLIMVGCMVASLVAIGGVVAFFTNSTYASGLVAFAVTPGAMAVWSLGVAGVAGVASGRAIVRVGGRVALAGVLAVGVLGIPFVALTVAPDIAAAPIWFQLSLCAVLFPSTVMGAVWRLTATR